MITKRAILGIAAFSLLFQLTLPGQQVNGNVPASARINACSKITNAGMHYLIMLKNKALNLKNSTVNCFTTTSHKIKNLFTNYIAPTAREAYELLHLNKSQLASCLFIASASSAGLYFLCNETDAFHVTLPILNLLLTFCEHKRAIEYA